MVSFWWSFVKSFFFILLAMTTESPRVKVIITGGTICMRPAHEEGITQTGLRAAPLEEYLRRQPEMSDNSLPDYDVHEWKELIDSSDVTGDIWAQLVNEVAEDYDKYDGFVILHGTDTLAYTASALSFMLEGLGKPVILTGAMLPISHIHTDARRNVTVSLLIAGFSKIPEVLVVFGSKILRGCRASKRDCTSMDAFDSPNCPPLGRIGIDIIVQRKYVLPPPTQPLAPFLNVMASSVVCLTVTPSFPPFLIRHIAAREERPLGIVLRLFGTGTAPTGSRKFQDAIQFAIDSGVTIVAVTQCSRGTCSLLPYENGVKLHNAGVIEAKDMTTEAAFVKLAYLMGKGYTGHQLQVRMEREYRGEMTEHPTKIIGQASLKKPTSPSSVIQFPEKHLPTDGTLDPRHAYTEREHIESRRASQGSMPHVELIEGVTFVGSPVSGESTTASADIRLPLKKADVEVNKFRSVTTRN
eukprot:Protomagalhaensia_sp_Gyna_25__3316@NODE_2_length_10425_cov_76_179954_g1_i0_p4_GENE_NODE_2_length_10425_cov_76_179954_g1_i0NODE_2_length_10425_cov_76_179954_g1_i0_p4_ORF_typecomplete_len469_score60_17Asparaginase/PF00710_20/2_7e61Asparaginase_C/PF17763_1/4_4e25_NODE_2_length_10425_cov_76_179954_g1_i0886410270